MPRRNKGYLVFTVQDIQDANPLMLGVKLGKACVAKEIPVTEVAEYLDVSRTTIYAWFMGRAHVSDKYAAKVEDLIQKLS